MVEQIAELRVGSSPTQVAERLLVCNWRWKRVVELQQRGVQSQSAQVAVAQGVADFAWLACVDDTGYVVGDRVDEGAETK